MKEKILIECKRILDLKVKDLQETLEQVRESANSESKSTAGDKYEITRAMMQLEQEKLAKQLAELIENQKTFEKIDPEKNQEHISFGSFVETNNGNFFISAGIGKITIEEKELMTISPASPIGKCLIENQKNKFLLNGKEYLVRSCI